MILLFGGFLYLMGLMTADRGVINMTDGVAPFLTNTQYFLIAIGATALLFGAYVLAYRNFKVKPKAFYIVFGIIFFICAMIPVAYQMVRGSLYYTPNILQDISYPIIMVAGIIFALSCFPRCSNGTYIYTLVALGIVITAMYGCIYSYVTESEMYSRIFNGIFPSSLYDVPKSFTGNRNVFAWLLLMGQIAFSYLETRKSSFFNWLFMVFFFFNQFFVISKTGMLLSAILLAVFAIYRFIVGVRDHLVRTLAILAGSVLALILAFCILQVTVGAYFNQYLNYIGFVIEGSKDISSYSVWMRIDDFQDAYSIISSSTITKYFGFGYSAWQKVLFTWAGKPTSMDISWGVNLLQNGFAGIAISAFIWLIVLFTILKAMKQRMRGGFFFLLIYLLFLARSVMEAADFVRLDLFGALLYAVIYLPCASHIAKRKELIEKDPLEPKYATIPFPEWKPTLAKVYAYMTPLWSLLLAFSDSIVGGYSDGPSRYYMINLIISYIVSPLLISGAFIGFKKGKVISPIFGIIVNIIYLAASVGLPIYRPNLYSVVIPLAILVLAVIISIFYVSKDMFKGIWKTYIRYILMFGVIGGGFWYLMRYHPAHLTPYVQFCRGFIVIDAVVVCFAFDTAVFSDNWPTIAYWENKWERFSGYLEEVELTSLFISKKKRKERYSYLNIYND